MASHGGLAEVLRRFGPAYLATHTLRPGQAKAWRAILACRPAAPGGPLDRRCQCGTLPHGQHPTPPRPCARAAGSARGAGCTGTRPGRGTRPCGVPSSYKARTREEGKKLTWKDGVGALWILMRERYRARTS